MCLTGVANHGEVAGLYLFQVGAIAFAIIAPKRGMTLRGARFNHIREHDRQLRHGLAVDTIAAEFPANRESSSLHVNLHCRTCQPTRREVLAPIIFGYPTNPSS